MTKKYRKAILIFAAIWLLVAAWSIVNITVSISGMNYLEQDIEHNYITWCGVEYGIGMGSLSFCARAMASGTVGIMLAIMSLWIFPTWLKITRKEEDERS